MTTNNEAFEKWMAINLPTLSLRHDTTAYLDDYVEALYMGWEYKSIESEKEIAELQAQVKQLNVQMEADDKLINIYQRDINKQDKALVLRDFEIMKLRDVISSVRNLLENLMTDKDGNKYVYITNRSGRLIGGLDTLDECNEALSTPTNLTHLQDWYESMVGEAKPITGKLGDMCSFHSTDIRKGDKVHAIKEFKA